jgi:hypothetical protein
LLYFLMFFRWICKCCWIYWCWFRWIC